MEYQNTTILSFKIKKKKKKKEKSTI